MLKRSSHCKVSAQAILKVLHARGVSFRPLRQKHALTPEDVVERLAFAKTFVSKSVGWWKSSMHMVIDIKLFRVLPHGSARRYATQKVTRGTHRKKGQGLCNGHRWGGRAPPMYSQCQFWDGVSRKGG